MTITPKSSKSLINARLLVSCQQHRLGQLYSKNGLPPRLRMPARARLEAKRIAGYANGSLSIATIE